MKIDPNRLLNLRRKQGLTRPQLAERSGRPKITVRTIQRLENEPEKSQKTRKDTLNRLAKALGVKPGVLTGELPLPESGKAPAYDTERVQIGAQVAPKVRLAYDLIKRRYGVSATEIINMAPLFFALIAEGSLAWRREKLKEAYEAIDHLEQVELGHGVFTDTLTVADMAIAEEEESIAKNDLFGEHLLQNTNMVGGQPFDPSKDNPFASYLRELKGKLAILGVVDVDSDGTPFGSPLKFPDYDICRDEIDHIANSSHYAKMALEIGYARLSEIPEELMAEDANSEERAKWLEDRVPRSFKKILEKKGGETVIKIVAKDPKGDLKDLIEDAESQETNPDTEKGGDDQ